MLKPAPTLPTNVKWFGAQKRRGRRSRPSPQQLVGLRLRDFAILFRSRYGAAVLPDDDSGRDDIEPVIHHLAALRQGARHAEQWLELWAPWMTLKEKRQVVANAIASVRTWTADQLAWRYRVTKEERRMLGLTTIGSVDESKAARTKRRRERDRQRKQASRRAAGMTPRSEYERASVSRAKPWIAEGISRRTWYRRRGTSPATA